jgi:hypothetical protein
LCELNYGWFYNDLPNILFPTNILFIWGGSGK